MLNLVQQIVESWDPIVAESQCDIYEPLSLNFGHCKMIVAIKKNQKFEFKAGEVKCDEIPKYCI